MSADSIEKKLYSAAKDGNTSEVSSLLRDHPLINVNWFEKAFLMTSLHISSYNDHVEVVKLLLVHPHIDVNLRDSTGKTPISCGCEYGRVSVVKILLKHPRVDVTLEDNKGRTSLWYASCYGHNEVIEWLVASGRDLGDVKNKKGGWWVHNKYFKYTSLDVAIKTGKNDELVSLLKRFVANPAQTRHELRVKLGMLDALAAEVFALIVFLCDDLFRLDFSTNHLIGVLDTHNYFLLVRYMRKSCAFRFFSISRRLPMELQMLLCHRVVGSMKQNILNKDSELAFKSLANDLLS